LPIFSVLVDDVLVRLGITLLVVHVPAESYERVNELLPELWRNHIGGTGTVLKQLFTGYIAISLIYTAFAIVLFPPVRPTNSPFFVSVAP
jgi:hypothetical protein